MVHGERTETRPLGLGLKGSWIELVDSGPDVREQLGDFDNRRRLNPAMGARGRRGLSPYGPPMVIRDLRSGRAVGMVENHGLPAGIAVYLIYLDPELGRPGFGLEATALYVSHLFDHGARLVTAEVLSFNLDVIGIMRKAGWPEQARLREHVFAAGRFWDVLVYSFDQASWERALSRYRSRLPGGGRRPAAAGR